MSKKTGSWLAVSTLAVAALWAAPAQAYTCYEYYDVCMEQASYERDWWIREHLEISCSDQFRACLERPIVCGDYYCGEGEDGSNCPSDCY